MSKLIMLTLVGALTATAAEATRLSASPDLSPRDKPGYAQVISSRPVYRPLRVEVPRQECWQEPAAAAHDASTRMTTAVSWGLARRVDLIQRCRTVSETRNEYRLDGYEVTYRYEGRLYTTRMPYDPGDRVPVRLKPRPVRD